MAGAVAAWLLMAATVQARVSNDWRTQYQIDRYARNRGLDAPHPAETEDQG